MKDALSLGMELKEQEKQQSEHRIARALKGDTGIKSEEQILIASKLYETKYEYSYKEIVSLEEILEGFCWRVFGANFEEVMEAYDKFLG